MEAFHAALVPDRAGVDACQVLIAYPQQLAAAVIGGTSLFGGVATVGGSMVGSLLPVILASGLIVIGVESFYQQIVVGLILILAVYIDQERRSRRESL